MLAKGWKQIILWEDEHLYFFQRWCVAFSVHGQLGAPSVLSSRCSHNSKQYCPATLHPPGVHVVLHFLVFLFVRARAAETTSLLEL